MVNPKTLDDMRRDELASEGVERPPVVGDDNGPGNEGSVTSEAASGSPRIDAPHVAESGNPTTQPPASTNPPVDAELSEEALSERPMTGPSSDPANTTHPEGAGQARRGLVRRGFGFIGWLTHGAFCIVSLVVLLATLTAVPIFQLIAFGYLLSVAGGLAAGGRFRDAPPQLQQAGQIGLADP